MQRKATLFLVVTLFVIPIFVLIGLSRKRLNNANASGHPAMGVDKLLLDTWKNQEFITLTNGVDLRSVVANSKLDILEPIDIEQKDALTESAVNLIACFETGTFEDYARFRFPVKFVISPDIADV